MFSILTIFLILAEALLYYKNGLLHYVGKSKVLPSNSLNTVFVENKEKIKNDISIV